MWPSHEERNGFLSGWQTERTAKINSCGISGPAGPLEQEMIKRSHAVSLQQFRMGIFFFFRGLVFVTGCEGHCVLLENQL